MVDFSSIVTFDQVQKAGRRTPLVQDEAGLLVKLRQSFSQDLAAGEYRSQG